MSYRNTNRKRGNDPIREYSCDYCGKTKDGINGLPPGWHNVGFFSSKDYCSEKCLKAAKK